MNSKHSNNVFVSIQVVEGMRNIMVNVSTMSHFCNMSILGEGWENIDNHMSCDTTYYFRGSLYTTGRSTLIHANANTYHFACFKSSTAKLRSSHVNSPFRVSAMCFYMESYGISIRYSTKVFPLKDQWDCLFWCTATRAFQNRFSRPPDVCLNATHVYDSVKRLCLT